MVAEPTVLLPQVPTPHPVQRIGPVNELRALGLAVDVGEEAGACVLDHQMIATCAELEVECCKFAVAQMNIVNATVGVHIELLCTNRLEIDLVSDAAGVDIDPLFDGDVGKR